MKYLKVTVNGVPYDVQVEELAAPASVPNVPAAQPLPSEPAEASVVSAVPSAASVPAGQPSAEAEVMESPMPGTILRVEVQPGQQVTSGSTLLILEAMKMENEIMAPHDAVVDTVLVSPGQSVEPGTPLLSLR